MSHAIKFLLLTAPFLTLAATSCSHRPVDFYNDGVDRQARGDWDGAIADYTQAIALKPKFALAYDARGLARQAKGDWDSAIADYDQAIQFNPKDALACDARGQADRKSVV